MGVIPRVVMAFLTMSGGAYARDLAQLGPLRASAGEAVSGYLEVPALGDNGARIPVSLVRGSGKGPVLALVAGTHGYEYPGISALQRLRQSIDPRALRGTLILVHIANPPSFYGRTIYTSPADGKNLNRVFPGRPDGTLSERIAYEITTQVIAKADFLVDLHAGDGNEALRPYVYMPITGDAKLDAASRGMALAFGLDHIVIDAARITGGYAVRRYDRPGTWRAGDHHRDRPTWSERRALDRAGGARHSQLDASPRDARGNAGGEPQRGVAEGLPSDSQPSYRRVPRDRPRWLCDCRRRPARRALRSLRRKDWRRARALRGHRQLRGRHAARGRGSAVGDG